MGNKKPTYVDFDYGITVYTDAPTKSEQFNREQRNTSRFSEKPNCITSNDQKNCFTDEEPVSNTFVHSYKLWYMDSAALKSLKHTNDGDSMSNQYAQPTTQQPGTES